MAEASSEAHLQLGSTREPKPSTQLRNHSAAASTSTCARHDLELSPSSTWGRLRTGWRCMRRRGRGCGGAGRQGRGAWGMGQRRGVAAPAAFNTTRMFAEQIQPQQTKVCKERNVKRQMMRRAGVKSGGCIHQGMLYAPHALSACVMHLNLFNVQRRKARVRMVKRGNGAWSKAKGCNGA